MLVNGKEVKGLLNCKNIFTKTAKEKKRLLSQTDIKEVVLAPIFKKNDFVKRLTSSLSHPIISPYDTYATAKNDEIIKHGVIANDKIYRKNTVTLLIYNYSLLEEVFFILGIQEMIIHQAVFVICVKF